MKSVLAVAWATIAMSSVAAAGPIAATDVAFEDGAVASSLTGAAGDPVKGRELFAARKQGNCLACHQNADLSEQSFHGEVGPALDGVGDRWSEAELRGIVVNPKMMFEGTIMPSFYRTENGARPLEKFADKSILSADEVEHVVAYLLTLKE